MNNIDGENMESYLTVYNFGFICYKLALYCETIMCLTCVLEVTMKSLQICAFQLFFEHAFNHLYFFSFHC